jgi:hypothetical protein
MNSRFGRKRSWPNLGGLGIPVEIRTQRVRNRGPKRFPVTNRFGLFVSVGKGVNSCANAEPTVDSMRSLSHETARVLSLVSRIT